MYNPVVINSKKISVVVRGDVNWSITVDSGVTLREALDSMNVGAFVLRNSRGQFVRLDSVLLADVVITAKAKPVAMAG